jgi:hypothetical protein
MTKTITNKNKKPKKILKKTIDCTSKQSKINIVIINLENKK